MSERNLSDAAQYVKGRPSTIVEISPRLRTALEWAESDYRVFPLQLGTKNGQLLKSWKAEASSDPAQILKWSAEFGDCNFACAIEADHCVADTDSKEAEQAYRDLGGTEKTFAIRTPRGGRHYHLLGDLPNTASKFGPGLDTRGAGGYVLLPGSRTEHGEYTVVANDACVDVPRKEDRAALPAGLKTLAVAHFERAKEAKERVAQAREGVPADLAIYQAKEFMKTQPVPEAGKRDNKTTWVMFELRDRGMNYFQRMEIVEAAWPGRNTDADLDRISSSVDRNAQNAVPGTKLVAGGSTLWPLFGPEYGLEVKEMPPAANDDEEKPYVYLRDQAAWDTTPDPEMLVEHIIPAKRLVYCWGDTGVGKTYWTTETVCAVATNRPVFGKFKVMKTGIGVIFAGEDCDFLEKSRLAVIRRHFDTSLQGRVFTVDGAFPVTDPNRIEKMCEEMRRIERQVGEKIVIAMDDTLKRSLGDMNPNAGETGMIFTQEIEKVIREFGCTMLVNAHQPKSGAEGKISGTGTFIDNAPVTWHLLDVSAGDKLSEIRAVAEPKFRIGPKPEPFTVKATTVALAQPVAGFSSDLVFTALTGQEAAQRAAQRHQTATADTREMRRVIFEMKAHVREKGLLTADFAALLAGPEVPPGHKDRNAWLDKVDGWKKRLNAGAKSKGKDRKGQPRPPKFAGWFEKDHEYATARNGELRWFLPMPAETETENLSLQ